MPSNKDLTAQATELAAELKLDVVTKGLNNAKLAELVSDLKAKKTDADTVTSADKVTPPAETTPPADAPPADAPPAETTPPADAPPAETTPPAAPVKRGKGKVYVAEGKALTTKRGILGPGEQIFAEDLAGGKVAIDGFIESGHLEKA